MYFVFLLPSRYGREDEELMGLRFCNEIVIAAEQLHPSPTTTTTAAAAASAATSNHSSSSDGAGRPGGRKRGKDKGEEKEASASKEGGGGGKKKDPAISVEASADASGVKKLQVNQVNQIKSFPANWKNEEKLFF